MTQDEQDPAPAAAAEPETTGRPPTLDAERLAEIVAAIPPGHWMSYGDVVAAAGGSPRQALGINGRLTRLACPGAHRVLKDDGTVASTALDDPESVYRELRLEGLEWSRGRAPQERRVRPKPVPGEVDEAAAAA